MIGISHNPFTPSSLKYSTFDVSPLKSPLPFPSPSAKDITNTSYFTPYGHFTSLLLSLVVHAKQKVINVSNEPIFFKFKFILVGLLSFDFKDIAPVGPQLNLKR